MVETDKLEFVAALLGVALVYEKTPNEAVIEIYWEALKDLSIDDFKAALVLHVRDGERGRFMPKPADVVHFASGRQKTSLIAWTEVVTAMERHGRYLTVRFADAVTNAVIRDLGGWVWICDQDIGEPWTQKEFERRYQQYSSVGFRSTEPLLGLFEIDNREKNLLEYVPETVLIESRVRQKTISATAPSLRLIQ